MNRSSTHAFKQTAAALVLWLFPDMLEAQTSGADSLSLRDFLTRISEANPRLRSAELEQDVASAELKNALGGFDPVLSAEYEYKTKDGKSKLDFLDAGLELPLATLFGPKLVAKYKRGLGTSVDPQNLTAPDGEAAIGVKVPLLQGIFTDKRRAVLSKAELRPTLSNANQLEAQNALFREASEQYWTWAETFALLQVTERVFTIALDRRDAITVRARAGEAAPIDSIEAAQEVERRRGDVLKAKRSLEKAAIKLGVYLWTPGETLMPKPLDALPAALPPLPVVLRPQIERDKQAAVSLRPEATQASVSQQSAAIELNFSYERQRPMIEAQVQALYYKFGNLNVNDYKIGLSISQPLLFRSANAETELAKIYVQRTALKRLEVERKVVADVDDAVSAIERALERVEAAEAETRYAVLMEQGERQKFQAGETSLLILNLRERAAAEAQAKLVSARADYLRSVSDYLWATGRISEKWVN